MYVVDNEITVCYVLAPTDTPLTAADYDISIVRSTLAGSYTDAAISDFVAPTEEYAGSLSYKFTPLVPGHFRLYLTVGAAASSTVLNEKDFWVFADVSTTARGLTASSSELKPGT